MVSRLLLLLFCAACSAAAPACTPSPLGYQCLIQQDGVDVHFSLSSQPPDNECTRGASGGGGGGGVTAGGRRAAHFAVTASTPGYVALAFAGRRARMFPADAVVGSAGGVKLVHISKYAISPRDVTHGWATGTGFVSQRRQRILCFSRALVEPQAAVVKSIDPSQREPAGGGSSRMHVPLDGRSTAISSHHHCCCHCRRRAALLLNWALGDLDALGIHGRQGSLAIDLASGSATPLADSGTANYFKVIIAHASLMMVAFLACMPAASIMARHKWLAGNRQVRSHVVGVRLLAMRC